MELRPYAASGKTPLASFAVVPLAVLAGHVVGALYAAFDVYLPIVGVFTILACVGAPLVLAAVLGAALRATHSRSRPLYAAVGLVAGASLLYGSWGAFVWLLSKQSEDGGLSFLWSYNPVIVLLVMFSVLETGWFEIKGATPSGWVLAGIWVVEAAFLFLVPVYALATTRPGPYCEACGAWASGQPLHLVGRNPETDWAGLVRRWDVGAIAALAPVEPTQSAFHVFELHSCERCRAFATVRVQRVELSKSSNGTQRRSVTEVVAPHLLGADDADRLLAAVAGAPG